MSAPIDDPTPVAKLGLSLVMVSTQRLAIWSICVLRGIAFLPIDSLGLQALLVLGPPLTFAYNYASS